MKWKSKIGIAVLTGIIISALIGILIGYWIIKSIIKNPPGFWFWAGLTLVLTILIGAIVIKFNLLGSKAKINEVTLVSLIIAIMITVFFLRWVIKLKYRCDPGALTILFVGGILLIAGLIFYSLGGDFSIFDVTQK
jgi:hypothetical protein